MASSMIVSDCYSLPATRLIHLNRRNGTELVPRCVVGQFRLRSTTVFGRSLSVGSSSSLIPAISAVAKSEACWAKVIDGKAVAETIRDEVTMEVMRMKDSIGKVPGIAIISFGYIKDSATCVKKKAFRSVGMELYECCLRDCYSEEEVLEFVSGINDESFCSGVIFQQPLPSDFDEEKIFNALSIEKVRRNPVACDAWKRSFIRSMYCKRMH